MLYSKYTRFIGNNLKLLYILMMNKKHRNQKNKVTDVHFVSVMGNLWINISIWAEGAMKQSHLNLRKNGLYKTVPVNNPYVIMIK